MNCLLISVKLLNCPPVLLPQQALRQRLARVRHGRHDDHRLCGAGVHVQRLLQLAHHHGRHLERGLLLRISVGRGRDRHGARHHGVCVRAVAVFDPVKNI